MIAQPNSNPGITFEDAGDIDLDHDGHGLIVDGQPMTEADYDATDAELAERTERMAGEAAAKAAQLRSRG